MLLNKQTMFVGFPGLQMFLKTTFICGCLHVLGVGYREEAKTKFKEEVGCIIFQNQRTGLINNKTLLKRFPFAGWCLRYHHELPRGKLLFTPALPQLLTQGHTVNR